MKRGLDVLFPPEPVILTADDLPTEVDLRMTQWSLSMLLAPGLTYGAASAKEACNWINARCANERAVDAMEAHRDPA